MNIVQRDRNAMELFCFGFLAVSVFKTAAFIDPLPPSLIDSPVLGRVAVISLFVGCVGAIVGIAWRDFDHSLVIEQAFLPFAALGCFMYAIALTQFNTFPLSSPALGFSIGTGAFCVWRFFQVQRYVKYRRNLHERMTEDSDL